LRLPDQFFFAEAGDFDEIWIDVVILPLRFVVDTIFSSEN